MRTAEYAEYDALGLAELIVSGQVTQAEVSAAALSAIEQLNPKINALVEVWGNEPQAVTGPFKGVPFLVKDLGLTAKGHLNELGSRLAAGCIADEDSNLMTRLRQAGLVTIGRTTTPELAASTTTEAVFSGPTRNPWDLSRSAGGSSGGSAAAVAAGLVPAAHATDGGGSIRVPSASAGLFGLKSSRGRVSMGPAVDEVWAGLAVHGVVSRTVRDSAALLDAIEGVSVPAQIAILLALNSAMFNAVPVERMPAAQQAVEVAANALPDELRTRLSGIEKLTDVDREQVSAAARQALSAFSSTDDAAPGAKTAIEETP